MSRSSSYRAIGLVSILLLMLVAPTASASGTPTATIHANWVLDENENLTHGYVIAFSEDITADRLNNLTVVVTHNAANGSLIEYSEYKFLAVNHSIQQLTNANYSIELDNLPDWKDSIEIEVRGTTELYGQRTIVVTSWNEPIADHEITRTTTWQLEQIVDNGSASGDWNLFFTGQGWQQRNGLILQANELGAGWLSMNETEDDTTVSVMLFLDNIWLNESSTGRTLDSQIFEMFGNGTMTLDSTEDGVNTTISANVSDSFIRRALVDGVVDERLRLEANGQLAMSGGNDDETIDANGDVGLLLLETWDHNGTRMLQVTEFEATADMLLQGEDGQFQLDLNELTMRERWENGTLESGLSRMRGDGAFDFAASEENSTIIVNGTVIDFFQETVDGEKTGDAMHIDGTITGDIQGTFGVVRDIVATGEQANATNQIFPVNVIHTESWLNLTQVAGNPFELEANHNQTWEYEVPYEHWDNRTVRLKWDSNEGGEQSQGEEYPERSPIMQPHELENDESVIGDVDVTREAGLAPAQLSVGDRISLIDSELMHLTIEATSTGMLSRDGHNLPVTYWAGDYGGDSTATGAVVNEGILAGLLATVERVVEIDMDESGQVLFTESQSLYRVLSPALVTAAENTPPSLVELRIQEGTLLNENGGEVHLEAEIDDPDWNLQSVTVDLSSLGLGTLVLNDLGLDGDTTIHDDVYTARISYAGDLAGEVATVVTMVDDFTTVSDSNHTLTVTNRLARITDLSYTPNTLMRGAETTVALKATDSSGLNSVAIDLTPWGGEAIPLSRDGDQWVAQFTIPTGMPPGDVRPFIQVEDGAGGAGTVQVLTIAEPTDIFATGETWTEPLPDLLVLNEGPSVTAVRILLEGEEVEAVQLPADDAGARTHLISVQMEDPDGVTIVQARLGVLADPGSGESWLSLRDDGTEGDLVANDGNWSIAVNARPGVPAGAVTIHVRGTDVFLAQTDLFDQEHQILLEAPDEPTGGGGGDALMDVLSNPLIIILALGVLLLLAGIGVALVIRKGGMGGSMGGPAHPWDQDV